MTPIAVTYLRTSDLIPYARNSRLHSEHQVTRLASSIREFGWTNPILVDGNNGIIAGHGRVLAALKLGLETVPTIELSHLSETQRRAYVIADNRLAEDSTWDKEMLRVELDELKQSDFDLYSIGCDAFNFSIPVLDAPTGDDQVFLDSTPQGEGTTHRVLLRYRNFSFPMTDEEQERFDKTLAMYSEQAGTYIGFVNWLLDGEHGC